MPTAEVADPEWLCRLFSKLPRKVCRLAELLVLLLPPLAACKELSRLEKSDCSVLRLLLPELDELLLLELLSDDEDALPSSLISCCRPLVMLA